MERPRLPPEIITVLRQPSLHYPDGLTDSAHIVREWDAHGPHRFLNLRDFRPGWADTLRRFASEWHQYRSRT